MAVLQFRLEYFKDDTTPSNESVYVQLKQSPLPSTFMPRTSATNYVAGTSTLGDALFSVTGVTEVSIQAYRVWLSKSPVFDWNSEIIPGVISAIQGNLSLSGALQLQGSPVTLTSSNERLSP